MGTIQLITVFVIIAVFFAIGIVLLLGRASFLLGVVRDMEDGAGKKTVTRIFGGVVLLFAAILTIVILKAAGIV